jgi:glycosyltransferase involved in cell wall biosynthesis
VIVPSIFAATELEELLGIADAVVIPHGLSAHCSSLPATDRELRMHGITGPFILHAAGATERKNLSALACAWRVVATHHSDLTLVLCGMPDARRDRHFARAARVVKTGHLEPATITSLMRRAIAVVVPSTYEGFGLPALEGMACGAPVIAANRGALPEVCGDSALLVEPDGDSIAEGVERVLSDPSFASELRRRGPVRAATFDWGRAAQAHLRVYEAALQ